MLWPLQFKCPCWNWALRIGWSGEDTALPHGKSAQTAELYAHSYARWKKYADRLVPILRARTVVKYLLKKFTPKSGVPQGIDSGRGLDFVSLITLGLLWMKQAVKNLITNGWQVPQTIGGARSRSLNKGDYVLIKSLEKSIFVCQVEKCCWRQRQSWRSREKQNWFMPLCTKE